MNLDFNYSQRELLDAGRLALQSAVAASTQFLAMSWLAMPEKFVGIISAVLVVEPSIGNTLKSGQQRVVATLVGSGIGLLSFIVLPEQLGAAVALAVAMLLMNALAGLRPSWRYGVVAAVALALRADTDPGQTAVDRGLAIALGAVVGTAASLVVLPEKAETRAYRHLRDALSTLASYLRSTLKASTDDSESVQRDYRERFTRELSDARSCASGVRIADATPLRERLSSTQRAYNAALILERVAEQTSDVQGDQKKVAESIHGIREQLCAVVEGMAERGAGEREARVKLRQRIEELKQRRGGDGDATRLQTALHFGLDELASAVDALGEMNDS